MEVEWERRQGGRAAIERQEGDPVYADNTLVVSRAGPFGGLVISGLIDHHNARAVARSLSGELVRNADLHVDVTLLEFCDVNAIKAIVGVARNAAHGRLILHGLPDAIVRVLVVVGWSDLPNLVLDDK